MDYKDINPIVDVPDTPDRLSLSDKGIMEGSNLSVARRSRNFCTIYGGALTQLTGRDQLVAENARKRRLHFHPCRGSGYSGRPQHSNNSVVAVPCTLPASETAFSFETAADKILKHESSHHGSTQHADDESPVLYKSFPKTSRCQENSAHSNVSKPSILGELLANPSSQSTLKDHMPINLGKGSSLTNCSSFYTTGESSTCNCSANKRKANVVDGICKVVCSNVEHAKGSDPTVSADSFPGGAKTRSRPVCSIRSTGTKRLVRNGCISPHNIAKAKERAESSSNGIRDIEQICDANMTSIDPCLVIDIDEVIGKEHTLNLVKGKGAINHSFSSQEHNAESEGLCDRSSQGGDGLGARGQQIQADEMFARELQEQLYQEMPEVRSAEVRRQSRYQPFQNHSLRRGTRVRNHGSTLARLRSLQGHPSVPLAQQNINFPSDMDLDMRIELLEALEARTTDSIRMVTQLLYSGREFSENDYEMLLALDENNQEHHGASFDQITNLPQSTVQTENGEACSICLEMPVVGDTIRHLPCLHKFHKHCIDPWLRRKSLCPVCKSNIA